MLLSDLTERERRFLQNYEELSEDKQKSVDRMLDYLLYAQKDPRIDEKSKREALLFLMLKEYRKMLKLKWATITDDKFKEV